MGKERMLSKNLNVKALVEYYEIGMISTEELIKYLENTVGDTDRRCACLGCGYSHCDCNCTECFVGDN